MADALCKVYPEKFTAAEEGPDRKQARLKLKALVEKEGSREGKGDRTADERSLARKLSCRLYLLLRIDGEWQLPQTQWASERGAGESGASAREEVAVAVAARCGEELQLHWMGNAPIAHLATADTPATFFWRLQHFGGAVHPTAEVEDYGWLTKEELAERLGAGELSQLVVEMCGPFD
eukprot:CAMPEP_0119364922 /NCGR_PEP_ID=MMETSP1334-20130426/11843_1 /TAXON_ID=127549 /ORGANISM="Calcidiscus leptoporus, Strain RCC1130" /LENGTH=177 /DNA_ID=CAMNT_0007380751 /DNA_START=205 /DNA_END=738 /DNA_ORIENTATION=-